LLAAAVPGFLIFADFYLWMAFSPSFSIAVGLTVAAATLIVTRLLYDDVSGELEAWRAAAPDLSDAGLEPSDAGSDLAEPPRAPVALLHRRAPAGPATESEPRQAPVGAASGADRSRSI
jgi:hypothetical protein